MTAEIDEEWLADQFFEKGKQYQPPPSHYLCKEFAKIFQHVLKHSRYELRAVRESVDLCAPRKGLAAIEAKYSDFEILGLEKEIALACAEAWGLETKIEGD